MQQVACHCSWRTCSEAYTQPAQPHILSCATMVNLGLQNFKRPTSLRAWIREDPDTVFRLSSLGIAWGSIIAAVYTMALDGGNYLVIPTGIIVLWDCFYLYRRSRGNPVIPRRCMTWDGIMMALTFAWAIVYMIITFGNVGQPDDGCGFDLKWCKNMIRVSAAECSSTLLLFPLS